MNDSRDLDDYARRAAALGPDDAAMLADPATRHRLWEEITLMQATEAPRSSPPARSRLRVATIGAAIVVLAVIGSLIAFKSLGSSDQAPTAAGPSQPSGRAPSGDVYGGAAAQSCLESYSLQTVAKRGFAFDGTVLSISESISAGDVMPYVSVAFVVNRWFRGGAGTNVTVLMLPPAQASVESTPYQKGSRLLVSGEPRGVDPDPDQLVAWACGFTRWYDPSEVRRWEENFR